MSAFQCRTRLCGWCNRKENNYVHQLFCFNAARGFVGGATLARDDEEGEDRQFQCRTRLCGWCNEDEEEFELVPMTFQCRTRLCGWCNLMIETAIYHHSLVSMPHAALWVVQLIKQQKPFPVLVFQCRTRLCGWCNSIARSPCPPRGKKPFWKVSGNLSVLTENM